jgi:lipoprotein-releasing system permease protein
VKIINLLATIGITIGVASIIFVVSILSGFQVMNYQQILGYDPHVRVKLSGNNNIDNSLIKYVRESENMSEFALTTEKKSALRVNDNFKVARLLFINPMSKNYLDGLNKSLIFGELQSNSQNLIMGAKLAEGLDITRGDEVELITPEALEKSARLFRQLSGSKYLVSGIFYSSVKDYDEKQIYIYDNNPKKDYIDIKLTDYSLTDEYVDKLQSSYKDLVIFTWKDLNSDFYKIMQFEKVMTIIVLFLIILISAFNILASLSMTVVQKKKDISILRTLGMSKNRIVAIFRNEGIFIGVIGTILGTTIGLILTYLQDTAGLIMFGKGITIQSAFPISYEYEVYVAILVLSVLLSWGATYLPTKRISKIDILDGIREE